MRISTSWAQQLGVNAMNTQQVKLSETQMQLSAGLKILRPSDDPAAATRTLNLQEAIDKTEQYQKNIDSVRSRLNIEEASLETAEDIMFRAKELTIQALNGSLTDNDRVSIKYEIDQMLSNLVGVANTRNANGEYIFSGDLSSVKPFEWSGDVNGYVYQGGINQRVLDIAPDRQVADGDLGFNVFHNISSVSQEANATVDEYGAGPSGFSELNKRSIFDTLQSLSLALDGKFDIPKAVITGDRFNRYGATYAVDQAFTLTGDGGTVNVVFPAATYSTLDDVVTEINTQISASNMLARSNGNSIEFVSTSTAVGVASTINIAGSSQFLTDFGFADGEAAKGVSLGAIMDGAKTLNISAGNPLDYSVNNTKFELVAADGSKQEINLTTSFTSLSALVTEIQTQITGSPIAGKIEIDSTANPIQFNSISSGTKSSVQIMQVVGDFLTDTGFSTGQIERVYDKTVNDVLTDIDTALDNFLKTRTSLGARINAIDDQESQNEKFVVDLNSSLSETRDLDYAEAISRFNIEQTSLQAAQQAYSRVQNLSLFNFL